jgi:hypothetical protein
MTYPFHKICYHNNNEIFFDLIEFKEIANADNCVIIVQHFINIGHEVLKSYDNYIVNINATSLKILDLEKYLKFIQLFNVMCIPISSQLNQCNIYNAPTTFKQIYKFVKMFINKETLAKVNLCK